MKYQWWNKGNSIDGLAMSAFGGCLFACSMYNFHVNDTKLGLVFLGLTVLAGCVAVKIFQKKS